MPGETRRWKRPCLPWTKYQGKPVEEAQINSWYGPDGSHRSRPNMCVVTGPVSGVWVLDVDLHKCPDAATGLQALLAEHNGGRPFATLTQRTGGGGLQFFFRLEPGLQISTFATPTGIDVRGQGGLAMLPPSIHESGQAYRWIEPRAAG